MFWDNIAWIYDIFADGINRKANRKLCKVVAGLISPTDDVLECACGTGLLSGVIAKRCKSLTATDFSAKMLARTRKKYGQYPHVQFEQADILHLPYSDARFDAVVAANVIHLLDNPHQALRELDRVCKPGGKLIIPTYMNRTGKGKTNRVSGVIGKAGADDAGAGKRKRIIHSYFISMVFSFGIALVMSALLVIFGRQFLGIFTNVEEVAQAGMIRLRIMGCSYAFSAFMDCTIAANRGLGKSFVPTVIVIMGSCVFRIIWVYTVFAYFHTIESLYLLYIVSWAITAAAEMICLRRVYREQMQKLPPDIDGVKAAA